MVGQVRDSVWRRLCLGAVYAQRRDRRKVRLGEGGVGADGVRMCGSLDEGQAAMPTERFVNETPGAMQLVGAVELGEPIAVVAYDLREADRLAFGGRYRLGEGFCVVGGEADSVGLAVR